ncbi:RagB/SusD family nutrient uptake outer membrane protein [Foetidibacter luteolus]|uniref:RagB/SusD family nutrient uptake outer membrane protein n=1 Tax=Foetidibacter luteolus TaxID=2608880 RepID=UPI00129A5207|nr:RagB/SusD family nutrient uptake outer membrane protein [Foetidibacter luteolus]
MKRIIYIFSASLLLVVTGCRKTLYKDPVAQLSTDVNYITADDARRAITAAYAPAAGNNWCCTYVSPGFMHWVLGNVASDDTDKGGESGSDQLYAQQVQLFNIPADNDATRFAYQVSYVGVNRTNLALENIPNIEMDATLKERYLAEAKFMRAWYYINLVKTFGDVPLVLTSQFESYDLTRSPKADVYAQIIKDLTEAEAVLPKATAYPAADHGRATQGAAQAYLGKVYLYLHDFAKAEEWFGKLIASHEYALESDYYFLFTRNGETSKEHVFQVKFLNDLGPQPANNQLGIVMGSRAMNGWGFNLPTQDFVDAFEPGDPRLWQTVYKNGDVLPDSRVANVGNSTTGYLNKKVLVLENEKIQGTLQAGKDDIYMRLGKVYLWYAEAANEVGKTNEALQYLNEVRRRARQGNANILPDVTVTGKDALRQLIWKEQRVEFGQEYERFFELVRQGRAGQVLRAYATKYNTAKGEGFTDGVNEIFPIPLSEINLSKGKITQNPGY